MSSLHWRWASLKEWWALVDSTGVLIGRQWSGKISSVFSTLKSSTRLAVFLWCSIAGDGACLLYCHFVDLDAMACLKWILQNDVESFLACLFHFGGMNLIMLNNTLLMAIVTVCRHVLLCAEVHVRDYISRNPKAFSAHFVNVSYYVLVVDLGFSYQVSGFTKKSSAQSW